MFTSIHPAASKFEFVRHDVSWSNDFNIYPRQGLQVDFWDRCLTVGSSFLIDCNVRGVLESLVLRNPSQSHYCFTPTIFPPPIPPAPSPSVLPPLTPISFRPCLVPFPLNFPNMNPVAILYIFKVCRLLFVILVKSIMFEQIWLSRH